MHEQLGALRTARKQLTELAPHPRNPRAITDDALAGLTQSLTRFGYVEPIVWNERTGHIVGGHQRLKVLQAQGVTEADVVVVDMDEPAEKALLVELNNRHITGHWTDELGGLLEELKAEMGDGFGELQLAGLGSDLNAMLANLQQPGDEDWAAAFEQEGDTGGVDRLRQVTFVLEAADMDRLKAKLAEFSKNKNEALVQWLNQAS